MWRPLPTAGSGKVFASKFRQENPPPLCPRACVGGFNFSPPPLPPRGGGWVVVSPISSPGKINFAKGYPIWVMVCVCGGDLGRLRNVTSKARTLSGEKYFLPLFLEACMGGFSLLPLPVGWVVVSPAMTLIPSPPMCLEVCMRWSGVPPLDKIFIQGSPP